MPNPNAFADRENLRNVREVRTAPLAGREMREVPNGTGGTNLRLTGFACVTGATYVMADILGEYTESVSVGAFRKSLGQNADVAMLLNHGGMTLARTKPGTLKLSEVEEPNSSPIAGVTGLHFEALLDPTNPTVQSMRSAVERGDLDECSFAFRVVRQQWSQDYSHRSIVEVSLEHGDVSLCNFGANPHTGGTVSMRQRHERERHERERVVAEARIAARDWAYMDRIYKMRIEMLRSSIR
ncbi:MAG: hypothetical protein JWM85_2226 [Acidimicrobiaceae bacterium]|nr:hypothetical protein [Acidimicrobiaceae bacterium]